MHESRNSTKYQCEMNDGNVRGQGPRLGCFFRQDSHDEQDYRGWCVLEVESAMCPLRQSLLDASISQSLPLRPPCCCAPRLWPPLCASYRGGVSVAMDDSQDVRAVLVGRGCLRIQNRRHRPWCGDRLYLLASCLLDCVWFMTFDGGIGPALLRRLSQFYVLGEYYTDYLLKSQGISY